LKLISKRSKGRHAAKRNEAKRSTGATAPIAKKSNSGKAASANTKLRGRKLSRKKKIIIAISTICGLALLTGASAFAVVMWEVQPFYDFFFRPDSAVLAIIPAPNHAGNPNPDNPNSDESFDVSPPTANISNEANTAIAESERDTDIFTFLFLGIDGHGNTDVIMVGALNTIENTLNVVSIPRDTMVNVEWSLKKVNSIQPMMRNRHRGQDDAEAVAMQATIDEFAHILGFPVDFWITMNMNGFVSLVDSIGGVNFNVPVSMNWRDPDRGHHYVVSRGQQRLNGVQALGVVRFRGYGSGDLSRVATQGAFIKATVEQLRAGINVNNIPTWVDTFMRHVRTNIQVNHMVFLGKELLKVSNDNINFSTMPGTMDSVGVQSYITLHVDDWLDIVNTQLSPLDRVITPNDVSILTRGADRRLYVTDGNWRGNANWGASSRGPAGAGSANTQRPPEVETQIDWGNEE